jgi:hypothetical protein
VPRNTRLPSFPVTLQALGDPTLHPFDLADATSVHENLKDGTYLALIPQHPTTPLLIGPEFYGALLPYLAARYVSLGTVWINPAGVLQMRQLKGELGIQFAGSNVTYPDHAGYPREVADLARRSGLTSVGRQTYVSLSDTFRYDPKARVGFMETGEKKPLPFWVEKEESRALVDLLDASDWLHLSTGDWTNPEQIQIMADDVLGYTLGFTHPLSMLSAADAQRIRDLPDWFQTRPGCFLHLARIKAVGPRPQVGVPNPTTGTARLGNGYEVPLPYETILILIHHFTVAARGSGQ